MPGTTPTVDTVRWRAEMPEVVVDPFERLEHGLDVRERLAHAHEHDVATRWSVACCARTTCSTISPASRWRSKPAWPVAQNVQPIAQPACDDTHTVARSR